VPPWHKTGAAAGHTACIPDLRKLAGVGMLHSVIVMLFAIVVGFTASGIVANLYRLLVKEPKTKAGKTAHLAVMVVAGPNVLFENAAQSFRSKKCSMIAFWLAAAVSGYWSFIIGLFVLNVGVVL
jgi:hypothetical protein